MLSVPTQWAVTLVLAKRVALVTRKRDASVPLHQRLAILVITSNVVPTLCVVSNQEQISPSAIARQITQEAIHAFLVSYIIFVKKKIPFINLNLVKGVIERPSSRGDCRANGCGTGANCLAQGDVFVCRCSAGLKGDPEVKCTPGTILKIKINPNNIS